MTPPGREAPVLPGLAPYPAPPDGRSVTKTEKFKDLRLIHLGGEHAYKKDVDPHFPYQPCRTCRIQQQNYLM